MTISGSTRLFGLIGSPVAHSLSPAMYNACFEQDGIDAVYLAFDVPENVVSDTLQGWRAMGFAGGNVTMPDKNAAAELMDALSPAAQMTGAVNTIVREGDRLIGHNTDGIGMTDALREHGATVADARIVILGAGGAAAAILAQCVLEGAAAIAVFNRDVRKAQKLIARICTVSGAKNIIAYSIEDVQNLSDKVKTADILINATSVGMMPDIARCPLPECISLPTSLTVADAVYHPIETALLVRARASGCVTVGGIDMLRCQGAAAYRLFTGREMSVDVVRRIFDSCIAK